MRTRLVEIGARVALWSVVVASAAGAAEPPASSPVPATKVAAPAATAAPATKATTPAAAAAPTQAVCIVCAVKEGKNEPEKVKATSVYEGRTYYFCSAACKKTFDAEPAAYAEPALPRPAPSFRATTLTGDSLSLEGLRGKVVLLDFWATWCAPCVKTMPELQKLSDDYRERGLVVLGLSTDEDAEKKVRSFITAKGIRYPIALDDSEAPAWAAYRVVALPSAFLIDQQGRIVRQWTGRTDPTEMHAAVEALLKAD